MKSSHRNFAIVALSLCLAISCGGDEEVGSQDFSGRLQAALEISTQVDKERMLAVVAVDAAAAGNADVSKRAIAAFSSQVDKEATAAKAAVALAKAGKATAAIEIAKMIDSVVDRDRILAEIARIKK